MARIGKRINRKTLFSFFLGRFSCARPNLAPFPPLSRPLSWAGWPACGPARRLARPSRPPPRAAHRPADSRPSRLAACTHPSRACALSNRSAAAAFPVGPACKPVVAPCSSPPSHDLAFFSLSLAQIAHPDPLLLAQNRRRRRSPPAVSPSLPSPLLSPLPPLSPSSSAPSPRPWRARPGLGSPATASPASRPGPSAPTLPSTRPAVAARRSRAARRIPPRPCALVRRPRSPVLGTVALGPASPARRPASPVPRASPPWPRRLACGSSAPCVPSPVPCAPVAACARPRRGGVACPWPPGAARPRALVRGVPAARVRSALATSGVARSRPPLDVECLLRLSSSVARSQKQHVRFARGDPLARVAGPSPTRLHRLVRGTANPCAR
jgi:hypothetical protein